MENRASLRSADSLTGFNSCTLMGPRTGLLCRKKRNLPDLECCTAFSMKSTIVLLLNLANVPKLKLPAKVPKKKRYYYTDATSLRTAIPVDFFAEECDIIVFATVATS